jgi:hypothetical protein
VLFSEALQRSERFGREADIAAELDKRRDTAVVVSDPQIPESVFKRLADYGCCTGGSDC